MSHWIFFLLVFALSVPLWLLGPLADRLLRQVIPINLPVSALQAVIPLIAASILVHRESGAEGVRRLLKRAVDWRRINNRIWWIPILFLWPALMVLEYGIMRLVGSPLPQPVIPIRMVPVLLCVFFLSAAGEQLGWSGYATDRLQARWSALSAAVVLGLVWGIWHVVPLLEAHRSPAWIAWQCLGMVPFRVLIAWLYNSTGKSVLVTIAFQDTANVSQFMFPNLGSHYDPSIAALLLTAAAAIVTFVWGPQTLARNRYARPRGEQAGR